MENIKSEKKLRNRKRFRKDTEKKVNQIFKSIKALDKILHQFNNEYTQSDINKIYKSIDDTVKLSKDKFKYSLEHSYFKF